jgi:competence protein ComGC
MKQLEQLVLDHAQVLSVHQGLHFVEQLLVQLVASILLLLYQMSAIVEVGVLEVLVFFVQI